MMQRISATVLGAWLVAGTAAAAAAQTPPTTPARPPAAQTPPATPPRTTPAAPTAPAPQAAAPAPVAFPADAKIGFIDMQSVVNNSKLGKAGQEQLKQLSDKRGSELTTKNTQLKTLQTEVQTGASVLSAAVLSQKNSEIDRLTREIQFAQEQAQADVQALSDQLLQEFGGKVLPIVEQIRNEKGLWVVFTVGDGTGIAAVHPGLDLSAEVVKRLDASK
jgi:outer membrane protein